MICKPQLDLELPVCSVSSLLVVASLPWYSFKITKYTIASCLFGKTYFVLCIL